MNLACKLYDIVCENISSKNDDMHNNDVICDLKS